jgi:hypothetical protein
VTELLKHFCLRNIARIGLVGKCFNPLFPGRIAEQGYQVQHALAGDKGSRDILLQFLDRRVEHLRPRYAENRTEGKQVKSSRVSHERGLPTFSLVNKEAIEFVKPYMVKKPPEAEAAQKSQRDALPWLESIALKLVEMRTQAESSISIPTSIPCGI